MIFEEYIQICTEKLIEYAPRISMSIGILIATLLVSVVLRKIIIGVMDKKRFSVQKMDIVKLIASASSTTIMIIGIVSSLGTLGVNISALIAGLGLSGFALGFALKDALSNLLSGILIIMYQPFRTGDRIVVSGFEGNVAEINLRYTILENQENTYLIPNSNLFNNTVTVRHTKPE